MNDPDGDLMGTFVVLIYAKVKCQHIKLNLKIKPVSSSWFSMKLT